MYQRLKTLLLTLLFTSQFLLVYAQAQSVKSAALDLSFEWDQMQDWPKNTSWQRWEDQWIPFSSFDLPQFADQQKIQDIVIVQWSAVKKQKSQSIAISTSK
jgi:hypothetical protein